MPRGGEYDTGPTVASDNAIESTENKITGAPKGDSDEPMSSGVDRSGKAAPLPEGISEMKDASGSGSGSQGVTPGGGEKETGGGSGKGGN
ncbi:hypothetical protein IMSHALPRED_008213 [Imshaugia aleurites]|uniref:Uncharacterized protein n=1 Tax=Imshaugia aleurites TaxID=172621 RepID=A0A8H3IX42_9LECA|nr:hypothetical protein IMSHALPRED_008213 [Imshaugia aleurites]